MVLPFVRELLADLEHSEAFERVRRHLSGGTGRRRVSGLTFTARALYLPFFVRAANAPCVIIVADNKAAEALHAAVLSACELTGALPADSVLRLPAPAPARPPDPPPPPPPSASPPTTSFPSKTFRPTPRSRRPARPPSGRSP